jgi:hypothetical protein
MSMLALCSGCVNTAIGPDPRANVGTYSYVTRNLESLYSVPLQDLWPAALAAVRNLKLTLEENYLDALGGKVLARRADGTRVKIWLDPVGARSTTSVYVRVGFWGNKDLSERVHQEIRRELGF